jgi:uncharacterized protein YciI
MSHFLYRLIPPRPTFDTDMTEAEAGVMAQHGGYWTDLLGRGQVVVFGPVSEPDGVWGLAIIEAKSLDDARALALDDPAVTSGLTTVELHPMAAVVRT